MDPKTREEMGWPAELKERRSIQSTALDKRLRAEDIMAQTGSGAVAANGCFQKNMLKTLKFKEAYILHSTPEKATPATFPREVGGDNQPCTVLEKGQH